MPGMSGRKTLEVSLNDIPLHTRENIKEGRTICLHGSNHPAILSRTPLPSGRHCILSHLKDTIDGLEI